MHIDQFQSNGNPHLRYDDSEREGFLPMIGLNPQSFNNIQLRTPETDTSTFNHDLLADEINKFYLQTPTQGSSVDFFLPLVAPGNETNLILTGGSSNMGLPEDSGLNLVSENGLKEKKLRNMGSNVGHHSNMNLRTPSSMVSNGTSVVPEASNEKLIGLGIYTSINESDEDQGLHTGSGSLGSHFVPSSDLTRCELNQDSLKGEKRYELFHADSTIPTPNVHSMQQANSSSIFGNSFDEDSPTTIENISTNSDDSDYDIFNFSNMVLETPVTNQADVSVGNILDFDVLENNQVPSSSTLASAGNLVPNSSHGIEEHYFPEVPNQSALAATSSSGPNSQRQWDSTPITPKKTRKILKSVGKKGLKKAYSFNDTSQLRPVITPSSSTLSLNLNSAGHNNSSLDKKTFSLSECSLTFPVNSLNNWSFVMEHENVDNIKQKKKVLAKVDKPQLNRSTSATLFESGSLPKKGQSGTKVLKNMKSGMTLFQLNLSGNRAQ